ncbi:glycosyltransferase [Ferruginibacter albus]|uniref:glycosyltransferase n=1 Tax=Ferruginibacter albus TaxID=2875540 RepID=UPI001CC7C273|nr:glycosyltransferase [Ferruginibacter albus]UAY50995.1 glycosyltransferase [Ferruginibacter albus]
MLFVILQLMKASLIIPFYKDLKGLELIFLALNKQSAKGAFEVIIAEDAEAKETIDFLLTIKPSLQFPVLHTSQEDKGFRKCRALNNAVKLANSDYLVFIDGDCIPHNHLIKEYLALKEKNKVIYGRRVNLSQSITEKLLYTKNIGILTLLNLLTSKSSRVKEGLYLPFVPRSMKSKRQFWGCNWAVLKEHLFAINGFDEDYTEYGYEDIDTYNRLYAIGCRPESSKFRAIVYHLYHRHLGNDDVMARMKSLFEKKQAEGLFRCKNGIEKL